MRFIALRSLHRDGDSPDAVAAFESRYDSETGQGRVVDEDDVTGLRFINPSLIIPLEEMWVAKKPADNSNHGVVDDGVDETEDTGQSPWADETV